MWLIAFLVALVALIAVMILFLMERQKTVAVRKSEEEIKQRSLALEQTVTTLAGIADARGGHPHGHSVRIAETARKLAEQSGKSGEICRDIYFAVLLAREKIDVPDSLKGEDLPDLEKIVAVAEAYDMLLSGSNERGAVLHQKVSEEFIKGSGTQFDPEYARLMIHLIDLDTEDDMKEREESRELEEREDFRVRDYRSAVSNGILITQNKTVIRMTVTVDKDAPVEAPVPSLILFDSLDAKVHSEEKEVEEMLYFEYGQVWFDGRTMTSGARKMEKRETKTRSMDVVKEGEYKVEAVRVKDHVLIRVIAPTQVNEVIVALPDSTRFMYIGLTGEHLSIGDIEVKKLEEEVPDDFIPRIAEKISYIADEPVGDIPSVQVDGFRTASSKGILIRDGMEITFHTKSLPTARLVWHCPYIDIYCSDDGQVDGENYRDLTVVRLDGEYWETDSSCKTELIVSKDDSFGSWDRWKEVNKKGYDCKVSFELEGDTVTITTINNGISVKNMTAVKDASGAIYTALTGDQVALTNIRIKAK